MNNQSLHCLGYAQGMCSVRFNLVLKHMGRMGPGKPVTKVTLYKNKNVYVEISIHNEKLWNLERTGEC